MERLPTPEWLLLDQLYDASERGAYTACDGPNRKLAWSLEKRGLADWRGTNWGSHFFAITDAGRALIESEVEGLRQRLATRSQSA